MHAFLAGWRVSLRRTRADWPIVAAAWLITLLAAVLLSAGPIYSTAASDAGLRRALRDAPVPDTTITVSMYASPTDIASVDGRVQAELKRLIASIGGTIVRDGRSSGTLAVAGGPGVEDGDQAILGFLDDLPDHAALVTGAWPQDAGSASQPMQVAVSEPVAAALGLTLGDVVTLTAHKLDASVPIAARVVGVYAVNGVADPYWFGDQQLITGIQQNASYRTLGPFLTTPGNLLERSGIASVHMVWRTYPDLTQLTVAESAQLGTGLDSLPGRLVAATAAQPAVTTGLPAFLADAERSLLVTRAGVLLLMAQLAILAAYAITLTASQLVDYRRIDTALLRSRGAGAGQIALLALAEGLLLAVPAVIVAPWLAVAALTLLNVVGPLADVGLALAPRVTADGYLAAGAVGIVCVALLVLPALLAARGFAAEQRELSRQETRTLGQRLGLDVALLAMAAIALWQLRLYGAPLTRTVQGRLGLDPLLVAAPAIGLITGGVLALRILPRLAQGLEAALAHGRQVVGSLGSRQLARRPLRYTRSALLLMLAVSMGVFAVSYAVTWSGSQRDQARYQAGADLRVLPGRSFNGMPLWALPGAYARLDGIGPSTPVERIPSEVSFAAGSSDLLALDADTAAGVVLFRPDQSVTPLDQLMRVLRAGRPGLHLPTLPADAAYLRIVPRLELASIGRIVVDPATGEAHTEQLDPTTLTGVRVQVSAFVRDAWGLLYQITSDPVSVQGPDGALVMPLEPATAPGGGPVAPAGAHLDGPLELAGLGVDVWLPQDTMLTGGSLGVTAAATSGDRGGPWTPLALSADGGWAAGMAQGRRPLAAVAGSQVVGTTVRLTGNGPLGIVMGGGTAGPAARLGFLPTAVASGVAEVPVIVNGAFLAASGSSVGSTIVATVEGEPRQLSLVGEVDGFPTTDPTRPAVIMDEPTLGLMRLQGADSARGVDEWWFSTVGGADQRLSAELLTSPYDSAQVISAADRIASLSTDPVALGIIGALSLGFVVTGLFAVIGLTVSAAVSARERRTEFALMRALGLSGRQLAALLWLENGSLVLVSLLAGTGLGLILGWMALPFVTVTQQGTAPEPPVIVHVPWDRILLLDAVSAMALVVAVAVIGGVLRRLGVGSVLRMGED